MSKQCLVTFVTEKIKKPNSTYILPKLCLTCISLFVGHRQTMQNAASDEDLQCLLTECSIKV